MDSDNTSNSREEKTPGRPGVLVGRAATVRSFDPAPNHFSALHRKYIGKTGRIHAVVPASPSIGLLVKVGFDEGTQIVFFHLADLDVDSDEALEPPKKHGKRGSHMPG